MDSGTAVRKVATFIVIGSLSAAGTFAAFVTTPLTQTIPNDIAQSIGGAATTSGLQQFDLLDAKVTLAIAQTLAQIPYRSMDRLVSWAIGIGARVFICGFVIVWMLAQLIIKLVPILIALTLWTWLFDATRHIGERALSIGIALLVAEALILIVSTIVIQVETAYAAQHLTALQAASQSNPNLL